MIFDESQDRAELDKLFGKGEAENRELMAEIIEEEKIVAEANVQEEAKLGPACAEDEDEMLLNGGQENRELVVPADSESDLE